MLNVSTLLLRASTLSLLAGAALSQVCPPSDLWPDGRVFWTSSDGQEIRSSDLDGGNEALLHTAAGTGLLWLETDLAAGKLYFTDDSDASKGVWRMNLDGSGVELLVDDTYPGGFEIDPGSNRMYWTELEGPLAKTIRTANLDGTQQSVLVTGLSDPGDVDVASATSKLYWADGGAGAIRRANLDGSNEEDVITGLGFVWAVYADTLYNRLYYTVLDTGEIWVADLDGANPQLLVSGLTVPAGIEVSYAADLVLVAELGDAFAQPPAPGRILAMDRDGSDLRVLKSGSAPVDDIALDLAPVPTLWGDVSALCLQAGGSQDLLLEAGAGFAQLPYVIAGSANGTAGIAIGQSVVPLTLDKYTLFSLNPNPAFFQNTIGLLDAEGRAKATLVAPPGLNPGLAGLTFHHAAVVFDLFLTTPQLISAAVPLLMQP